MNRTARSVFVAALALLSTAPALLAQGFGRSVAVDDGQVLVLKPGSGRGPAAAYVYERGADGEWTEVQRLGTDVTATTGEGLGPGLVVHDGLAMIASADPDVERAAHVFRRQADGTWTAVEPIPMDPGAGAGEAGAPSLDLAGLMRILVPPQRSLSTDGERVLVGSVAPQGTGEVTLIERAESGEWRVVSELAPGTGDLSGGYGSAVLLTPDRAFVGAPRQDGGSGVVYVLSLIHISEPTRPY